MSRLILSKKQLFNLMNLIQAKYTEKGLSDRRFAEFAEIELKLEKGSINVNHVNSARVALEIPSTRSEPTPKDCIADLSRRLAVLEARLEIYISGSQK
jgi:hypothetical protein